MKGLIGRLFGFFSTTKLPPPVFTPAETETIWGYGPGPRCESRKVEGSRSWRCAKVVGHDVEPAEFGGFHENKSKDRRW